MLDDSFFTDILNPQIRSYQKKPNQRSMKSLMIPLWVVNRNENALIAQHEHDTF